MPLVYLKLLYYLLFSQQPHVTALKIDFYQIVYVIVLIGGDKVYYYRFHDSLQYSL